MLKRLAEAVDFMAYDVVKGKVVKTPGDYDALAKRLTAISSGEKIALQNVGWSTSKTDDSSEQEQVEFIREFFRVLALHRDRIQYAPFGSIYDHDTAVTGPAYRAMFPDFPTAFVDRIIDSMSHFGLFPSDGTEKPGWAEFRRQAAEYYSF